jgi:hypothetical protein
MYDSLNDEGTALRKIHALLVMMVLCFILVPIIANLFGGWYAYLGHGLLAIIFAILAVFIRTRYYWEED